MEDSDDMPNPLSRVSPQAEVWFSIEALNEHPEFSQAVMRVIHIGAAIEHRWSVILTDLIKGDPRTGIAMYQAVRNADARRAILLSAARARFKDDDYLLFEACMLAMTPARNTRNQFAHRLWGTTPMLPNALLLIDPEHLLSVDATAAEANLMMSQTGRIALPADIDRSQIAVWRKACFKAAVKEAEEAFYTVRELELGIHYADAGIAAYTRDELLKMPPVAAAARNPKNRTAPPVQATQLQSDHPG